MLDFETVDLGTKPALLQIAAVAFSMETWEVKSTFSIFVDYESGLELGLTKSDSTIEWWNQQKDSTKEKVWKSEPRFNTKSALINFISWALAVSGDEPIYLWGNGIKADNVWLTSALKAAEIPDPFYYRNDMDLRTAIRLAEKKLGDKIVVKDSDNYEKHNAIDDCLYQCAKLRIACKILNMGSGWARLLHRMNLLM
jgi:hypothetical protein